MMGTAGTVGVIVCLSYMVGLLATIVPWGGWVVLGLGGLMALVRCRYWRRLPRSWFWLVAGAIGLAASLWFQVCLPRPGGMDISRVLPPDAASLPIQVAGRVETLPHLTRSQKAQLWLEVTGCQSRSDQPGAIGCGDRVTGNLYVTVPLLQATGLYPGQTVQISGSLYAPKPASQPGEFDFQAYLKREGCFAGLAGNKVTWVNQKTAWGWWQIQRQIAQAQVRGAGSPAGQLISSIALGKQAVDLPFDIKDRFTAVGLAHALAASGTQVSLILGVLLAMTRRLPAKMQFAVGLLGIGLFVGMTGGEPAVLRAAVMGLGGLIGLVLQRSVHPIRALLLTATLLLLYQPQWIWDLGFQLSFAATLGLMVTVPRLSQQLDWLPGTIVPLVAVPIAAYLWTLPLQLFNFGVVSPYSIPVNLLVTPFISLISLGGMASALAAVVWPLAGSAIAGGLAYPTQWLLAIVEFAERLPGNAYAVGTISAIALVLLYGLLGLTCVAVWWQRRWWVAGLLAVGLVVIPAWQTKAAMMQATILATAKEPVMVVQDHGHTAVMNSGSRQTVDRTVLPFLQKQGVNSVDWAISPDPDPDYQAGRKTLGQRLPIRMTYDHPTVKAEPQPQAFLLSDQPATIGSMQLRLVRPHLAIAQFTLAQQTWLCLGNVTAKQQRWLLDQTTLPPADVLWWAGSSLHPALVQRVKPHVAIASAASVTPETAVLLRQQHIQLYVTGQDGAIRWTPVTGFKPLRDRDNSTMPL